MDRAHVVKNYRSLKLISLIGLCLTQETVRSCVKLVNRTKQSYYQSKKLIKNI